MKSTDTFKTTIQNHLNGLAEKDPLFAETLKKENKSIDGCCTYILNQVKASGCNGFDDSEIFGMAVHYYDEDDVKAGSPISAKVVVNHVVKLSAEDIDAAKKLAMDKVIREEEERLKSKSAKVKKSEIVQESLF